MAGINWRSDVDIDEENRYGVRPNPDRVVAVETLDCATCGGPITEVRFADGHKSYDSHGVCSGLGKVWHRACDGQK